MNIRKTSKLNFISLKVIGFIFITTFISAHAEQVSKEITSPINNSYLESKDELKDYILGTGDTISIRFKNKPRKGLNEEVEDKRSKTDISYLEPRNNLNNYILDVGDSIFIDFNLDFSDGDPYSGTYPINTEGEIYLPEIKNTYIKGLKIPELKILLEKRYKEYLKSPQIDIEINNFKSIESGVFSINEEGEILLPLISTDPKEITRKTYVKGLTTNELKKLLEKRYSKYLLNNDIFIDIVTFKPIRVLVQGEARKPGLVKFPAYISTNMSRVLTNRETKTTTNNVKSNSKPDAINTKSSNLEFNNNIKKENNELNSQKFSTTENTNSTPKIISSSNIKRKNEYLTTLSNAIQAAGGLTSFSDISKIKIIRDVPIEKGGGKKIATINFLSYINESDNSMDIRLFDGDAIFIPSLKEKDSSIIPKSILAGLSPRFINVSVSGSIENPGNIKIPLEGSLSDVMSLTGPRKPLSGKIYLIRYNQNGTLLRKSINYSANSPPGSSGNPILINGDLITVKSSILGRASSTIGAITEPFIGIYATKELIENTFFFNE